VAEAPPPETPGPLVRTAAGHRVWLLTRLAEAVVVAPKGRAKYVHTYGIRQALGFVVDAGAKAPGSAGQTLHAFLKDVLADMVPAEAAVATGDRDALRRHAEVMAEARVLAEAAVAEALAAGDGDAARSLGQAERWLDLSARIDRAVLTRSHDVAGESAQVVALAAERVILGQRLSAAARLDEARPGPGGLADVLIAATRIGPRLRQIDATLGELTGAAPAEPPAPVAPETLEEQVERMLRSVGSEAAGPARADGGEVADLVVRGMVAANGGRDGHPDRFPVERVRVLSRGWERLPPELQGMLDPLLAHLQARDHPAERTAVRTADERLADRAGYLTTRLAALDAEAGPPPPDEGDPAAPPAPEAPALWLPAPGPGLSLCLAC
jgi:hypothetical protein